MPARRNDNGTNAGECEREPDATENCSTTGTSACFRFRNSSSGLRESGSVGSDLKTATDLRHRRKMHAYGENRQ
jgi:hypothetical protein